MFRLILVALFVSVTQASDRSDRVQPREKDIPQHQEASVESASKLAPMDDFFLNHVGRGDVPFALVPVGKSTYSLFWDGIDGTAVAIESESGFAVPGSRFLPDGDYIDTVSFDFSDVVDGVYVKLFDNGEDGVTLLVIEQNENGDVERRLMTDITSPSGGSGELCCCVSSAPSTCCCRGKGTTTITCTDSNCDNGVTCGPTRACVWKAGDCRVWTCSWQACILEADEDENWEQ
ncbi:MAG: hypothetical protein AAB505_03015 [Patescibacteria group bacterium]